MNILLETYYILLPIIATAILGWVGILLKEQKKKESDKDKIAQKKEEEIASIRKANSEGIKLILRYMLKRYHSEYMLQEKITYNQYKDWIDLWKAYEALNGNSIAEEWNDDIEKLDKCDSISDMSLYETVLMQCIKK